MDQLAHLMRNGQLKHWPGATTVFIRICSEVGRTNIQAVLYGFQTAHCQTYQQYSTEKTNDRSNAYHPVRKCLL